MAQLNQPSAYTLVLLALSAPNNAFGSPRRPADIHYRREQTALIILLRKQVACVIVRHMSQCENMVQVSNERKYFSASVLEGYTTYDLMRTEAIVLLKYQPFFAEKEVLDIGIGAGRTTVYLAPLARRYVGIDFSPTFIDFVNKAMPQVHAQLGDMRDLREHGAGEFDFVMASYNVIDVVDHEDRIKSLSEVYRVLRPGGIFVFSSHNRAYELAGNGPEFEWSKNLIRQVRLATRWIRREINHAKLKKYQVSNESYAILTDVAYHFSTLHYYIDQISQRRQLEELNFAVLEVYDIVGSTLALQDVDTKSPFLMYVVQKPCSAVEPT